MILQVNDMQARPPSAGDSRSATTLETHPVLVPVDFSSCSRAALEFAASFIQCVNAPLLVLHVIHDHGNEPGFYRRGPAPAGLRPVADIAREMLEEFVNAVCGDCRDATGSVQPRLLLVSGLPASRIREIALREQAALIVMGTHARSGLARLSSGSVAAEVTRQCDIPVTIVKAAVQGASGEHDVVVTSDWWFHGAGKQQPGPQVIGSDTLP